MSATLASGANMTITLPAGQVLYTGKTGSGTAVIGPGPQARQTFTLGTGARIGPYGNDVQVFMTSSSGDITYRVGAAPGSPGGVPVAIDPIGPSFTGDATAAVGVSALSENLVVFGTWGDSRATGVAAQAASFEEQAVGTGRTHVMLAMLTGNIKLTFNGGLGGDVASNWSNAARTGSKTITAFAAAKLDAAFFQFGINSIFTYAGGDTASLIASVTADLKRNISALAGSVRRLYVESINACTLAGYGSNFAGKEAIRLAVNANLAAFCASVENVRFVDTDAVLMDPATGYLRTAYTDDGVHFNTWGSYAAAMVLLPIYLADFPNTRRPYLSNTAGPNMVDTLFAAATAGQSDDVYVGTNSGTLTINGFTIGRDEYGIYQAYTVTPTALASSTSSAVARIHARCAGGSPLFAVSAADKMRGGVRIVVDDGNGGAPNCNAVGVRLRERYSVASAKVAKFSALGEMGTPQATSPGFPTKLVIPFLQTPSDTLNGASADMEVADVANPARGLCLEVLTWSAVVGVPYRVRLYAPAIAKVE